MISIIICSQYPELSKEAFNNIASTIGVPYELVYIYNRDNKYSIFEAYNIGVERAKGDILCFMHNDLEFHSQDWGQSVERVLSESNVGACAIAGVPYVRKSPAYYPIGYGFNRINLIQATPKGDVFWNDVSQLCEIVAFDGLWFCVKAACFQYVKFDAHSYSGFHFYDLDIAMQLNKSGYRMMCLPDVIIKHLSGGHTNESWLRNSYIFANKWKDYLPVSCIEIRESLAKSLEKKALYSSIKSIYHYRAFDIIPQWYICVKRILKMPILFALISILINHIKHE